MKPEDQQDDILIPRFPPELEQYIFQTAARMYPSLAVHFMILSRRVHSWVEPILYEIVTLSNAKICQQFLQVIEKRPASFFASTVKSLCIPGDIPPQDAKRALEVCQGLENLAYWILTCPSPVPFSIISSLQPRRLSFNTYGLFQQTSPPDFSHPFFARVTHLEIVDWPWAGHEADFKTLPTLTHLAVDIDQYGQPTITGLRHILATCKQLLVLLCLVRDEWVLFDATSALASVSEDDLRLVILSDSEVLEHWEAGLRGQWDACHWTCAEEIIAARKKQMGIT